MNKAIETVRNEKMATVFASKAFQVPRSTLQKMARSNSSTNQLKQIPLERKPVLDDETEKDIVKYALEWKSRL